MLYNTKIKAALFVVIIIFLSSCSSENEKIKEINPFNNSSKDTHTQSINRLLTISQIYRFQVYEHELYNKDIFDTIQTVIKDPQLLEDVQLVRSETERIIDSLEAYHSLMVFKTGGYALKSYYKGGFDSIYIDTSFIKPNGPAEKIQKLLKDYSDLLDSKGFKKHIIAPIGKDNPVFKHHKNFKDEGFAYTYFKNANIIESVIIISYFTEAVLNAEGRYYTYVLIENKSSH